MLSAVLHAPRLWFSRLPHLHAPMYPMQVLPQGLCPCFLPWECSSSPGNALSTWLIPSCFSMSPPHRGLPWPPAYSSSLSIILYPLPCFIFLHHQIRVCLLGVCFSPLEFKLLSTKISVSFIHCGPPALKRMLDARQNSKYLFSGWMNDQWISLNFREIKSLSQE